MRDSLARHAHHARLRSIALVAGYRVGEDVWTAACGLFTLHNETLNVWTHLLGLVWFSAELPWVLERVQAHGGGWADTLCFALFIGCAQFQMFARWGCMR